MKPILIVEDEAIIRESLRDWLRDAGYEVETAEQGEEALQKLGEVDFGVAVLDLRLPGRDGLEVWKEARARSPRLKGVIITAYPSVETAVEAMKLGAVDYLVKPFAPDALENLIRETLGPVQVEIRPKTAAVPTAQAPVVEEAKVEATPAITEEAKEKPAGPSIGLPEEETAIRVVIKPRECVWMKLGVISHRLCTHDYDCLTCEFDQSVQERLAAGDPEIEEALQRQLELPGGRRLCRYALKGEVSYRTCSRLFQCYRCEFAQRMEDALEQKMAKLAARRDALRKKQERVETKPEAARGEAPQRPGKLPAIARC